MPCRTVLTGPEAADPRLEANISRTLLGVVRKAHGSHFLCARSTVPDLSEIIEDAADKPKSVTADGVTVVSRDLKDIVEGMQAATAATNVTGSAWSRLRPARVVPPGSIGPRSTE